MRGKRAYFAYIDSFEHEQCIEIKPFKPKKTTIRPFKDQQTYISSAGLHNNPHFQIIKQRGDEKNE